MKILFKCTCMEAEKEIDVPDRAGGDLGAWMDTVSACMGYVHTTMNPLCAAGKVEYVKVPFPEGTTELGTPAVRQ